MRLRDGSSVWLERYVDIVEVVSSSLSRPTLTTGIFILPVVCIIMLEGVRYIIDKSVPCVT
jgi:hypothetical protein